MALSNPLTTNSSEDSIKRGKLLSLSLLIALTIFIQTLLQFKGESIIHVLLISVGYFLITFFGLIWGFNFQVRFKTIPFLVQSSLFVLSEYLFVNLFFIAKFSRIYEGLLLFVLIALIFVGTYVSFLMANVFNVNLYKKIPLAQVGRTTSYIISTFTLFFLSFGILSAGLPIYVLIPLFIIISSFLSYIHLKNLGFESRVLFRKSFLVSLIVIFMFLGSFLSGVLHEVSVLPVVIGYFAGIGIANFRMDNKASKIWELILYVVVIIFVVILNLYLNIFR
jgi:hypothetical protein